MAKERAEIEVVADVSEAERGLGRLSQSLDRTSRASAQLERVTNKTSKAQRAAGMRIGENINQVSELAMGFSALSPKTRALGIAFATAGNSARTMGIAMGPIGAIAGAIAFTLPGLIQLLGDTGDELDETGRSAREAAKGLDDFIEAANRAVAARARASRLEMGVAGVEETRGALRQAQAGRGQLSRQVNAILEEMGIEQGSAAGTRVLNAIVSGDVDRTRGALAGAAPGRASAVQENMSRAVRLAEQFNENAAEIARRERELAEATEDANTALTDQAAIEDRIRQEREEAEGGGRGGGRAAAARAERERAAETRRQLEMQRNNMRLAFGRSQEGSEETDVIREIREEREASHEKDRVHRQAVAEATENQRRAEEELEEKRKQQHQDHLARMEAERAERLRVINAVSSGGEQLLNAFGASQGQMELWKGAMEVAEAIGSYPDPVGIAAHGLSAALHFKNAAEMGLGGGGGDLGKLAQFEGGQARPTGGAANNNGGGSVINVNFNAPMDEAAIGRQQERTRRETMRRFGRA